MRRSAFIFGLFTVLVAQSWSQTLDKKFFTVAAFHASSIALDGWVTTRTTEFHGVCGEQGTKFLYGQPTNGVRVGLVMAGEFVLEEFVGYELKKHRAGKIWYLPQLAGSVPHVWGAVTTIRNCY